MPSALTIVGVGPGDPGLRSLAAQASLDAARRIVLRTAVHPGVEDLAGDPRTVTCDDLYLGAASFDELYGAIADRVITELAGDDVVYAVPGSPTSGEQTVTTLLREATGAGHAVTVVPGVGGLDLVAAAVGLDLMADSVQIVDATLLAAWLDAHPFGGWLLPVVPDRPVVVTQVYDAGMRSAASAALASVYPDDQRVVVVGWDAAHARPSTTDTTLHDLDLLPVDHLTSVVVPAVDDGFAARSPFALDRVISYLRSPDGCPWDRAQTNESLIPSAVEEVFEVVDAVRSEDGAALADELGDLLLQPVIHAQIAAEAGDFDLADVFESVTEKLVRRHPHVFGDERADSPDAVLATWKRVKEGEGRAPKSSNPYERLPASMPPSIKVRLTIAGDGQPVSDDEAAELARTVAEAIVRLTAAGRDADALVDAECRILVDRALSTATRKD